MENKHTADTFLKAYDEHSDGLFRYALFKTSDREIALDITQDGFMRVWEYIQKGNDVENIKALLYRTIGNLIIDHYRRKKSESLDKLVEGGHDWGHDIREAIEMTLLSEDVWKYVELLNDRHREIITLRYMNDLSIKEIAEMIDESENTVSVRIHRALEKLREHCKYE